MYKFTSNNHIINCEVIKTECKQKSEIMKNIIISELTQHKKTIEKVIELLRSDIEEVCNLALETIKANKKIILFGNGGSAADAQHIAAELTGRYKAERKALPAIALTTDTSALTAIGNDFGYEKVFERQLEALGNEGDLLIGISSTGNSQNVIRAFKKGKKIGCKLVGFSGKDGGKFNDVCNLNIVVPSNDTPRIQEMHILIGHIVCQVIDETLS